MTLPEQQSDPFPAHRWWFKLKALVVTGVLAYPLLRLTGFSLSLSLSNLVLSGRDRRSPDSIWLGGQRTLEGL